MVVETVHACVGMGSRRSAAVFVQAAVQARDGTVEGQLAVAVHDLALAARMRTWAADQAAARSG